MSKKQVIRTVVLGLLVVGVQIPAARADFTFGPRGPLGPTVNSPAYGDCNPVLSRNGLELYFMSRRPGGYGGPDIWVSKRASVDDPWGSAVNLGPEVNTARDEYPRSLSSDGLTLYGCSAGTVGNTALYMFTRPTIDAPWDSRIMMSPVLNSNSGIDSNPVISADDLELYFYSTRSGGLGGADIYVSTRATRNDPWGPPVNLGPTINTPVHESPAWISPDGLVLIIGSNRPGGFGGFDGYMIRRPSKGAPWSAPVNLGPSFNTPNDETLCSVSPDGRWAYLDDLGGGHLWMAPILPIVDFNGDAKVDGKEVLALAQHWGQSQRLLDIGLSPMGDGVIDVNDLTALAGYIGQEVNDPTLIAHWALDETEGIVAADSVGVNNVTMQGDPAWQPADGKVGGALAFDGNDFGQSADFVLDPAAGPFSVIAWIKGGASGQVIVSQASGADWLYLNQDGKLATGLKVPGRVGKPLTSDAFLVDGQWHRVAVVSDGTTLALHVDGVEAAKDTQVNVAQCNDSLNIGAGGNLAAATFWSGLIDDVRIYNRAVQP
jgi:hypothetical protein